MRCWVAIAPLMDSTRGWRNTDCTGRYPKTIRSPPRSITSAKAVKRSIVSPRARSRWQFPCVASGSDRRKFGPARSNRSGDSFDVRRNDVTIEGDALRIRHRQWRFEFNDGVRVERVFNDWKAGTLPPVTAP